MRNEMAIYITFETDRDSAEIALKRVQKYVNKTGAFVQEDRQPDGTSRLQFLQYGVEEREGTDDAEIDLKIVQLYMNKSGANIKADRVPNSLMRFEFVDAAEKKEDENEEHMDL